MRVLVACAGREADPKWGGHLGVPKHLAPIGGVPLLHRTVAQVRAWRGRESVERLVVLGPDARYLVDGAELGLPDPAALHEYAASRPWWAATGRTVLLLGDVVWSPQGLARVLTGHGLTPRWWGRRGASRITGCRYGEIFAASWFGGHARLLDRHIALVDAATEITRPAGWKLYRSVRGLPMGRHSISGGWNQIDDETDDIDRPEDYERHPIVRRANERVGHVAGVAGAARLDADPPGALRGARGSGNADLSGRADPSDHAGGAAAGAGGQAAPALA
jgi:hypothetical protein